jgi:hypothetical protein
MLEELGLRSEMVLAAEVAAEKRAALARGEIPEQFFRLVPYDGPIWPPSIKNPGRRQRYRRKAQEEAT